MCPGLGTEVLWFGKGLSREDCMQEWAMKVEEENLLAYLCHDTECGKKVVLFADHSVSNAVV